MHRIQAMNPLHSLAEHSLNPLIDTRVGLNCSDSGECDDDQPCPTDSHLDPDTSVCTCTPGHCAPPRCPFKSKLLLTRNATHTPGDCCDVYKCISSSEDSCAGVVCPTDEPECPPDSSRLPKSMKDGDCCSVPRGCECFRCTPSTSCPPGQTSKVIRPGNGQPGSCCPIYECQPQKDSKDNTCIFNGEEKPDGSKWMKNQCSECTCTGGTVMCTAINCPPPPKECTKTTLPKGECCPVCIHPNDPADSPYTKPGGCMTERGVIYENGATWEEDDCTNCTCKEGSKTCQAGMCHQIENSCEPCEPTLDKDGSGNIICKCSDGPKCPPMTGCSKKCKYGYKTARNGCALCKCEHCKPIDNCKKRCPHGLQTNERGCPVCKCRPSPAINESIEKGARSNCLTDGPVARDDGEAWYDGCRQCYCYGGKEMCALVSCPKLSCAGAVIPKNSCCPVCPGNETRHAEHIVCYGPGGVKKEGETWVDGCMECICHGGRVLCHQEPCPPTLCTHPIAPQEGSCCPTCLQPVTLPSVDDVDCGPDRPAGSTWRQDSCVSCICVNGIADCYTQVCNQPDATCKNPLHVKNQCCSICFDAFQEENSCQVGNVTFSLGDVWEVKKCERCTCGSGRIITCTQTVCESGCSNSNPCCPNCSDGYGHDSDAHSGMKIPGWLYLVITAVLLALGLCTVNLIKNWDRFGIDSDPCNGNYKVVATCDNPPPSSKGPV
ncbi:Cysteine rich transmembrane BMP regulator 1 [Nesidiocoris tenuis]|uniref:Cysteine rich transmembrane BMP regulator 1 n=1 Tax=Nesidiocoris tenuis TaxID=355587 RepID=A0ABN7AFD8_9HEMI|nr:Cysteine rich transmembrane BMP regulator 1 [Nesidiocoris tenuis]